MYLSITIDKIVELSSFDDKYLSTHRGYNPVPSLNISKGFSFPSYFSILTLERVTVNFFLQTVFLKSLNNKKRRCNSDELRKSPKPRFEPWSVLSILQSSLTLLASPALVINNLSASAGDTRDMGLIPGERPGNWVEEENPMDRGDWWATVQRVTKSKTWLKWLSTHKGTEAISCWHINIQWILQFNSNKSKLCLLPVDNFCLFTMWSRAILCK